MRRIGGLLVATTLALATVTAQAPPHIYKLYLKELPQLPHGKSIAIEGTTDKNGDHFLVEALSVLQPVAVTLITNQVEEPLTLTLHKDRWDEIQRSATTGQTGRCTEKFRTQGDTQIRVSTDGPPRSYYLVVWVGEEVEPDIPSPFISMAAYEKSAASRPEAEAGASGTAFSFAGGAVLYVIAGALVLIVVLLAVMVFRKRS